MLTRQNGIVPVHPETNWETHAEEPVAEQKDEGGPTKKEMAEWFYCIEDELDILNGDYQGGSYQRLAFILLYINEHPEWPSTFRCNWNLHLLAKPYYRQAHQSVSSRALDATSSTTSHSARPRAESFHTAPEFQSPSVPSNECLSVSSARRRRGVSTRDLSSIAAEDLWHRSATPLLYWDEPVPVFTRQHRRHTPGQPNKNNSQEDLGLDIIRPGPSQKGKIEESLPEKKEARFAFSGMHTIKSVQELESRSQELIDVLSGPFKDGTYRTEEDWMNGLDVNWAIVTLQYHSSENPMILSAKRANFEKVKLMVVSEREKDLGTARWVAGSSSFPTPPEQ